MHIASAKAEIERLIASGSAVTLVIGRSATLCKSDGD